MNKHGLKKVLRLYSNLSLPVKASFWYLTCSILQKSIGLIMSPIYTRILTTQQFGLSSIYMSWETIFTVIATLYLYNGSYNTAMIEFKEDRNGYTSSIQSLTTCWAVIVMMGCFVFKPWIFPYVGLPDYLMVIMFIDIIVTAGMSFWSIRNRYEYKYFSVVIFTVLSSLFTPIISILWILSTETHKAEAKILGTFFVHIITYGIAYCLNLKRGHTTYNKEYWGYSLKFNLPLLPHYLSSVIITQCDKVMINRMCGVAFSGIYTLANNISGLMNIVTVSINQAMTPWIFGQLEKQEMKKIGKVAIQVEILVGALFVCVAFLTPELMELLATNAYHDGVWAVPPLLMGAFMYFVYCNFGNVEIFFKKRLFMMLSSMGVAIINIVLNALLIKKWGFIAASYATMISYYLYALLHYFFTIKVCKDKNVDVPFDGKLIFGIASIYIIIAIASMFLFDLGSVRYVTLMIFGIVIVVFLRYNWKDIFQVIKKV